MEEMKKTGQWTGTSKHTGKDMKPEMGKSQEKQDKPMHQQQWKKPEQKPMTGKEMKPEEKKDEKY